MPGRKLAVLIGIDQYRDQIPRLNNAVRDVRAVAQVLRELHGYETRCIEDEHATLQSIRELLRELPAELDREDSLLLYFGGHGIADSSSDPAWANASPRGYLIPVDGQRDHPDSFLPMDEVKSGIDKVACSHVLVCLDCCFAGAFRWSMTRDMRVRRRTLYKERLERYQRDPARQILVSAASDERALDYVSGRVFSQRGAHEQNSPFATALCSALRGEADLRIGGARGDGVIVASELHFYIEESLKRLEESTGQRQQRPLLWALPGHDKGEFVFTVAGRSTKLPSALALSEENNPYRGLEAYDEASHKRFFGRGALTRELVERVRAQPLTLVVGGSGTGKSSLVFAGLLPKLRELAEPRWHILPPLRPGNRPQTVLSTLSAALGAPQGTSFASALAKYQEAHPSEQILLFIDQLEELLTLADSSAAREEFLEEIERVLAQSRGALHLVMTLRADFEPHFLGFPRSLDSGDRSSVRFLIRPMNREELREAIEMPASESVLYFEPALLVDRIVDEVAEMPGALPLLSFTLSEMYRAYLRSAREDRTLTDSDYKALGEVTGALSKRADDLFKGMDGAHRATLLRVMLRMVALEAGEVARRRVPQHELHYGDGHPEAARVRRVLDELLAARLLTAGRDAQGGAYIEPAHDKLVMGWGSLWSLLRKEQENLLLLRRLTHAALDWERGKRSRGQLWSKDPRLPQVVALLEREPERYSLLERTFIQRSEARRRFQRRLTAGIVLSIFAVLSGLLLFSLRARDQALQAQRREQAQRQLAEQRLKDALEVAEALVFAVDRKLEPVPGAAAVRRELLDQSEQLIAKLLRNAEIHRSAVRIEIGRILQESALLKRNEEGYARIAYRNYERALALSEKLVAEEPSNLDYQAALALCHQLMGRTARDAARPAGEGIQHLERALSLYEQVSRAAPGNVLWKSELASTYGELGALLWWTREKGNTEKVEQSSRLIGRALDLIEGIGAPAPKDLDGQGALVKALVRICTPFAMQSFTVQIDNALGCIRQGIRIDTWLDESAPQRTEWRTQTEPLVQAILSTVMNHISEHFDSHGSDRNRESEGERIRNLQEGLSIAEKLEAIYPVYALRRYDQLAGALTELGVLLAERGQLDAALSRYQQALARIERGAVERGASSAQDQTIQYHRWNIHTRIGALHEKAGRTDAARASYEQAVAAQEAAHSSMPHNWEYLSRLAQARLRLARLLGATGEPIKALAQCEQAALHITEIRKEQGSTLLKEETLESYRAHLLCWTFARTAKDTAAETKHRAASAALLRQLRRILPAKEWQEAQEEGMAR